MRKFIIAVILLLAIAFVILSFSELENIVKTLESGDWRFIALAVVAELVFLFNLGAVFRSLFRLVGLEEDSRHLMLVVAAANFVNVVAPSAGIGGIAVLVDDARQRNHSTGKVTVVGALFVLLDYAAFLCVLALGWIVLLRRNHLTAGEITASMILLALAIFFAFMLYLGYRSASELGNALAWMTRLVNRILRPFIRREYLQEERAHTFAAEMSDGLSALRGKPKQFIWPFLLSLNGKALLICILWLSFLAFDVPYSIGTLVGGFSIAYLFLIVSPTPAGVGIVEGLLTVGLNTLRVAWEAAAVIMLTYRAVTFWFPLAVGALAFRLLHRSPKAGISEP